MKLKDIVELMEGDGEFEYPEERDICENIKAIIIDYLKETGAYIDDSLVSIGQKKGHRSSYVEIGIIRLCEICYRNRSKYLIVTEWDYKEFEYCFPKDRQFNNIPSASGMVRIILNSPDEIILYKDYFREKTKQILDSKVHMNCCDKYAECKKLKYCVHAYHDIISGCNYLWKVKDLEEAKLQKEQNRRVYKGESLIDFPDDYVIIDIETTGLDTSYDEIIEVSAIRYVDNKEVDRFSSLIQPKSQYADGSFIDDFIVELTGITNEMLAKAPSAENVLPEFKDFLGNEILIGHNVNFDINFLYDTYKNDFDCYLANDFIDTMRLSRRLHPEIKHHRLCDVADRYAIEYKNAHRALNDCEMTVQCYRKINEEILSMYPSLEDYLSTLKKHYVKHDSITHKNIRELCAQNRNGEELENMDIDRSNPLFEKTVVFTGTLASMTRAEAMQVVLNYGGKCWDAVTRETNYLVLGNNDYCSSIKDGKSNKQKKAEQLKLKGQDIEIISENVFWDLLSDF